KDEMPTTEPFANPGMHSLADDSQTSKRAGQSDNVSVWVSCPRLCVGTRVSEPSCLCKATGMATCHPHALGVFIEVRHHPQSGCIPISARQVWPGLEPSEACRRATDSRGFEDSVSATHAELSRRGDGNTAGR